MIVHVGGTKERTTSKERCCISTTLGAEEGLQLAPTQGSRLIRTQPSGTANTLAGPKPVLSGPAMRTSQPIPIPSNGNTRKQFLACSR